MKGIHVTKYGGADVLQYLDLPDPVPEAHQVLIKVKGASVNFADIKARSGKYHLGKKPPYIPGIDVAGIVLDIGQNVKDIKIGDHVIAFPASGSYAEKTVANENLTFVIPESINFESAAACPIVAGTVTHMLNRIAQINDKEIILIHAAGGGVGSTAVQLAKNLGIPKIIGSIGSLWKEKHVKEIGADAVINYADAGYAKQIEHLTDGKGVDVILNPIGGRTIEQDLQSLAPFGRLILYGKLSDENTRIPPGELYTTNKSVIGFSFGHYRRFRPELVNETMTEVINLLAEKRFNIKIGEKFALEQASVAHRHIDERKTIGKVLLIPEIF
ncbi:MAG: NADPH:quinone oxidoreductase family protein [Desulfobacterales bacterium]|nr:NADPH:quinone oxidoreductase family protein [Deltaproteobacteria bacterium]NNK95395.1 NADPH:quinone oxidoreductase family protein [Desulfobacterales bacterium]